MAHILTPPVDITVDDAQTYVLTITYGNGVMTGSSAFFDFDDQIQQGQITDCRLGQGNAIKGKTLTVISTLPADNAGASFVSVIYKINEQSVSRRTQIGQDRLYTLETNLNFN